MITIRFIFRFALTVALLLDITTATLNVTNFFHKSAFDDQTSDSYLIREVTLKTSTSKLDCSRYCSAEDTCLSFMVNTPGHKCRLHDVTLAGLTGTTVPQSGFKAYGRDSHGRDSQYGTGCQATGDCLFDHSTCNDGACTCDMHYKYSPSRDACVSECESLGSAFTVYDGYALVRNNRAVPQVNSSAECMSECLAMPWSCRSFEYRSTNPHCQLSDKAPELDGAEAVVNIAYMLYVRQCLP